MSDPKVQSWMFRAAQDVLAEDWDKRLKEICEERGGGPEFNVRAMILEAASIIARHAPDPASVPIGPGDVVQVVQIVPAYASGWHSAFEIGDTLFVCGVEDANALIAKGWNYEWFTEEAK